MSESDAWEIIDDSNAETTPSKCTEKLQWMSDAAKRRVDGATSRLTEKRCLIENTDESNHVEYAHCLPRSTRGKLLNRLEFLWGMDRNTLHLDTRFNVFRLSIQFHRAFDSNCWLLLPEKQIVERYFNAAIKERPVPVIEDNSYKYTLIAHPSMLLVPIHRQASPDSNRQTPAIAPQTSDFTHHAYPYLDFPVIESHVHPRFVICNSGSKLANQLDNFTSIYPGDLADAMVNLHVTWRLWRTANLPSSFMEKSLTNDDPDIEDNDSQRTAARRILPSRAHWQHIERGAAKEPKSPMPHGPRQRKPAKDAVWLDDGTLQELEQQTSSHADYKALKNKLILDWLNGVQPEVPINLIQQRDISAPSFPGMVV